MKITSAKSGQKVVNCARSHLFYSLDLSKKVQFCTDFSQNYTENHSTIVLPWQQRSPMGLVCIRNTSLLVYSKSHKV